MAIKFFYKGSVEKDLHRMGPAASRRVMNKFEQTISLHPRQGESLKGKFEGLYKYRVGDYRVIYTLIPDGILVLRVAHRREVYR